MKRFAALSVLLVACGGSVEGVPAPEKEPSGSGSAAAPEVPASDDVVPAPQAVEYTYTLVREDNLELEPGRIVAAWCEREADTFVTGRCAYRGGQPTVPTSGPTGRRAGLGEGWYCGGEGPERVEVSAFVTCTGLR